MPSITRSLTSHFPITSILSPFHKANWSYLLVSATATRFGIAALRVEENRPSKLKSSEMTTAEKQKAFAERLFIEFFGTAAYVFILHLGQDLTAKLLERTNKNLLKEVKAKALEELQDSNKYKITPQQFTEAFDKGIGTDMNNMLFKVLYGELHNGERVRTNRKLLANAIGVPVEELANHVPVSVMKVGRTLSILSTMAVFGGVIASAIVGGYGVQWLNDHPFSNYLRKRYPEQTPEGFMSLPSSLGSTPFGTSSANPFSQALISSSKGGY